MTSPQKSKTTLNRLAAPRIAGGGILFFASLLFVCACYAQSANITVSSNQTLNLDGYSSFGDMINVENGGTLNYTPLSPFYGQVLGNGTWNITRTHYKHPTIWLAPGSLVNVHTVYLYNIELAIPDGADFAPSEIVGGWQWNVKFHTEGYRNISSSTAFNSTKLTLAGNGTVELGGGLTFSDGSWILIDGSTVRITENTNLTGLGDWGRQIVPVRGNIVFAASSNTTIISPNFFLQYRSGPVSVVKEGAGRLLMNDSTLSVPLTINEGSVVCKSRLAPTIINSGGTLEKDMGGGVEDWHLYYYANNIVSGSGNFVVGNGTLRINPHVLTEDFVGTIVVKDGAQLELGIGTTMFDGVLRGNLRLDTNSTFVWNLTTAYDSIYHGEISGMGSVVKKPAIYMPNRGNWIMLGNNTYSGGTVIEGGSISVGDGGTAGSLGGNVTVNSGASFVWNKSSYEEFFGRISGEGTFRKQGSGTLKLNDYHSISSVQIDAGTLLVPGTLAVNQMVVESSGVLGGNGTITGEVVLKGTIAPGNSPGTLSSGSQIWMNGGNFNWQVYNALAAAGEGYDTLKISGTLDLRYIAEGGFSINLWSLSGVGPDVNGPAINFHPNMDYRFLLVSTTGGIMDFNNNKFVVHLDPNNGTAGFTNFSNGDWNIEQSGNDLVLTYTAQIPEPSSFYLLIISTMIAVIFIRRRLTWR